MKSSTNTRAVMVALLLLISINCLGCGAEDDEVNSPTGVRLRGLATMILDYAVAAGHGPADEQVLKKHMRTVPGFVLEMNGLDPKDIDSGFVSLRDGEPFVIRWGVGISISKENTPVLVHEKTGKHGKRLVAFANGKVEAVDEARFQELTAAKL